MQIEIIKLTPEKIADYLYFFENVAHTDNKEWDRCYCTDYSASYNYFTYRFKNFEDAEVRKRSAIEYINKGILQGYLAYSDKKVVGWCNANERNNCLHCYGWKKYIANKEIDKRAEGKVKSVFCFTVAPDYRGMGISTALLERVINDAEKDGYDYIEAYPNKGESDMFYNYVGPLGLYKKLGFEPFTETNERLVMRKALNKEVR